MNKRICAIVLAIVITFLSINPIYGSDKIDLLTNNIVENDNEFIMDFTIENMDFYPFIYSERSEWENDNVIGPNNGCEEGYLYSKELNTNIIRKLVNVKIAEFYETDDKIYFVYNNSIYSVDYKGEKLLKYYTGKSRIDNNIIKYRDGCIYFVENQKLMKMDEHNKSVISLFECGKIDNLYVRSDNEFVYEKNGNTNYYQINTKKNKIIIDKEKVQELYATEVYNDENDIMRAPVLPNVQQDTNILYVFSLYPNGSYFTKDNGPCEHHANFNNSNCSYYGNCNCQPYSEAIQCVGFAKYASDKYAHKTRWSAASGDINETDMRFSSASNVRAYFSSIKTGAYVLLSHYSEEYGEQRGFHALCFIKHSSDGIITYECNLESNCKVQLLSTSYEGFKNKYSSDWGIYRVSHNFNGTVQQYNEDKHIKYCSSSGCGGYIYEAHYAVYTGGNATCIKCGYVGPISYQEGLVQGTY